MVDINAMMKKLDEMYEKEEIILNKVRDLEVDYNQLQEDKELLQTMIMHQTNKQARRDGK